MATEQVVDGTDDLLVQLGCPVEQGGAQERVATVPGPSHPLEPNRAGAHPSASGSRASASSVSRSPARKCCCRNGPLSSNMLTTLGSGAWLEKVELCRG